MNAPAQQPTVKAADYVDRDTLYDIERFCYREARLLDEERFREWYQEMVSPEVHYYLPVREMRYRDDPNPVGSNPGAAILR